jgi:hypothetical protein
LTPSSPRGARALCVAIACPASNGRWTAKGSRRDAHAQRRRGCWVLDHAGAYTNVNARLGARELVRLCACANGGNAQVSVLRARPGGGCKDLVAVVSAPSVCGTVARCSHAASVAPSPPRRPDQRGLDGAALRSLEVNIHRGFRSFGCAGQPPVRCCRRRCRRRCARNLSVACAKVAFGRIVR